MKDVNNVILLTACVNSKGMAYTVLQDKDMRLKQYKDALLWYLEHTKEAVVLVENTMCDFSKDFESYIESGRLEFLIFEGNNYDRTLGKGFGEGLIIKYAMEHSKLLAKAEMITKITGRLKITNVENLVKVSNSVNTVYGNVSVINKRFLCDSRFFIAPRDFVCDYFLSGMNDLNDSMCYYFEHMFYDKIVEWKKKGNRHKEFYLPVDVVGISGTSGNVYTLKKSRYISSIIKYVAHLFGIYW